MPARIPPLRPVRTLDLPPGTSSVVGVFVNGVALHEREDYSVLGGSVQLRRAVRPSRGLSRRDLLKIALCVEVVPEGDAIDVILVRDGRTTSIHFAGG